MTNRTNTDDLIQFQAKHQDRAAHPDVDAPPRRRVAIVACMDARIHVSAMFGLEPGDAHVIRNAGGVVTDDVIRSICLSQRALNTTEIIVTHHTRCGMHAMDEASFVAALEADTGLKPSWAIESFGDPFVDTAQSVRRLRASPFIPHTDAISAFVMDLDSGQLVPVDVD